MLKKTWSLLRSPSFMVRHARSFFSEGATTIETRFRYQPTDGSSVFEHHFQTLIQIDGDIINFIPDPNRRPHDPDWLPFLYVQAEHHQRKLKDFLQCLNAFSLINQRFAALTGWWIGALGSCTQTEQLQPILYWLQQYIALNNWQTALLALVAGLLMVALSALLLRFVIVLGIRPLFLAWLRRKLRASG